MDLSFLKWPIIIGIVVLVGFLLSSPGVNYMVGRYTQDQVGADAAKDARNEAGLSRLGGYCLRLFKYRKALAILDMAVSRYPTGKNAYYNIYRQARCHEKIEQYGEAVALLRQLIAVNASEIDSRVHNNNILTARVERLVELHNLEAR